MSYTPSYLWQESRRLPISLSTSSCLSTAHGLLTPLGSGLTPIFQRTLGRCLNCSMLVEPFRWEGGNTAKSRRRGAESLAKCLASLRETYPGARAFLVGHSHGGNVAVEAASMVPVQGVVTLSTPFLALEPAPDRVVQALRFLALFLLSLAIGVPPGFAAAFRSPVRLAIAALPLFLAFWP